jgi:hypothetical protein
MQKIKCRICKKRIAARLFRWNSRTGFRTECMKCEKVWLRCSGCRRIKKHAKFPPSKESSTGRHSVCLRCHKERVNRKYHADEKYRRRHVLYQRSEKAKQWVREYNKRPEVRERARARDRIRHERSRANPIEMAKNRIRYVTNYAIATGRLVRPKCCQAKGKYGNDCIKIPVQVHHHNGYSKKHALDVEWLCPRCHGVANTILKDKGLA